MSGSRTKGPEQALSLKQRRAFMKLPLEERRRQMAEQAKRIARHYQSRAETARREAWQGGDIVEP